MSEVPDRIPGDLIVASYANTIRDRTVQRYVDDTERGVLNPVPLLGDLAYVQSTLEMSIWDGTIWSVFAGGEAAQSLADRVQALEDQLQFIALEGTQVAVQNAAFKVVRNITISVDPPSGGVEGDIWMQI